jgi:hypothetical protein
VKLTAAGLLLLLVLGALASSLKQEDSSSTMAFLGGEGGASVKLIWNFGWFKSSSSLSSEV